MLREVFGSEPWWSPGRPGHMVVVAGTCCAGSLTGRELHWGRELERSRGGSGEIRARLGKGPLLA